MDHSEVKHFPKVDHTPAELDEVSKVLLRAADAIDRLGWCQNNLTTKDGRVCLVGAIHTANRGANWGGDPWNEVSREAFSRVLAAVPPHKFPGYGPSAWNDTKGRTKDEVVAKLRAVALGL